MADNNNIRKELMEEIVGRKRMGDKKFHSESSLQQALGEEDPTRSSGDEPDPGVMNASMGNASPEDPSEPSRRRTMSQPGPVSGSLLTATAARAARRRPQRNVMYAENKPDSMEKQPSRLYLAPTIRLDDTDSINSPVDRSSPLPFNGNYRNGANGDARSINSYRIYTSNNESRGAATPRKRSVATMDAQSIRSTETHAPPPTTAEMNKILTTKTATISLSIMYAILLVTAGVIVHIADPILDYSVSISPLYSIILSCIGFLYMMYLIIDIHRYKNIALKNQKIKAQHEEALEIYFQKQEMDYGTANFGDRTPDSNKFPQALPPPVLIPLRHDYCFSQGRHSGSFYLKMGAAGFALGHLVHSLLLIAVSIGYILDENIDNDECTDMVQLVLDFINPFYCFFQLYFVFKYSNVIILRGQGVARFAFMHYIGTSLSLWISAIVRETVLALTLYAQSNSNGNYTSFVTESREESPHVLDRFFDVSGLYNENCVGSRAISSIYQNFSPYLYPFSVEFNILIVAIYYIIWSSIGHCAKESKEDDDMDSSIFDTGTICKIPTASEENDFSSNIVIYADCHASNRGLFLGMIITVLLIGLLILGFVFSNVGEEFLEVGYLLGDATKLSLHVCLLIAAIIACNQTRKLDINAHPMSLLDDVLLYICLPAFFMETILSMVATINILNVVKTIDFVIMVVQVIIQTALITDGLRRCSNSRNLRRTKPGREVIMFLLIINVGMWLFNTFSYKSPESIDERYAYYGKVMWSILGHISLPLIMFYRFHSSVCLADMWDAAYKPGGDH